MVFLIENDCFKAFRKNNIDFLIQKIDRSPQKYGLCDECGKKSEHEYILKIIACCNCNKFSLIRETIRNYKDDYVARDDYFNSLNHNSDLIYKLMGKIKKSVAAYGGSINHFEKESVQ